MFNNFNEFVYIAVAILIALVFHEVAHAYVSHRLGDPTPKETGRLSLVRFWNHLDPIGTIALFIIGFGWAKPVQVNPYYYKNKKQGMVLVALAGPLMNFIVAFITVFLIGLVTIYTNHQEGIWLEVFNLLRFIILINVGLGTFNLIPIPPLDGSKILGAILPEETYFKYMQYERYGFFVLIMILSFLRGPLIFLQESIVEGMVYVVFDLILKI